MTGLLMSEDDDPNPRQRPAYRSLRPVEDPHRLEHRSFLPREGTRRSYRAQGLGKLMPRLTRQMAGKRPTLLSDLKTAWPEVVGPEIAAISRPVRLSARTLSLEVASGLGPAFALQQEAVLAKIGRYLGADAVHRLRLHQVDFPLRLDDHVPAAPTETVKPGALRQALENLRDKLERREQRTGQSAEEEPSP